MSIEATIRLTVDLNTVSILDIKSGDVVSGGPYKQSNTIEITPEDTDGVALLRISGSQQNRNYEAYPRLASGEIYDFPAGESRRPTALMNNFDSLDDFTRYIAQNMRGNDDEQ